MNAGDWKFDASVAERFDKEARGHIPNYERVVAKCIEIAKAAFPEGKARIIDVGSATGFTLQELIDAGFNDVYGVDNAKAMVEHSRARARVILSDTFPKHLGPFDMVLANWTLHFLSDRAAYIRNIYEALSDGGIFILSEKMRSSDFVHDRYHDFKRSQGVSDQEIARKEASIRGVLVPFGLAEYMKILEDSGFTEVSVIDAHWCFSTLIAFKPCR